MWNFNVIILSIYDVSSQLNFNVFVWNVYWIAYRNNFKRKIFKLGFRFEALTNFRNQTQYFI